MTTSKPRELKVYLVKTPTGVRLVRALSYNGAIKHVVLLTHTAKVPTVDDLITAIKDGVLVEDAL